VQSADVFPAGRRLENLLVREIDAETVGVAALFEATDARVDEAFERISSLERRLQRLETATTGERPRELPYVVFLAAASGYRLVSAFGRLPATGDRIDADDDLAEVLRVGASPFPGDRRPCVFAVAVALPSADADEADASVDRRAA
jgi:hypothetical protein